MAGAIESAAAGGVSGGWWGAGLGLASYFLGGRQVVESGNRLADRAVQTAELGFRVPKIYGNRYRATGSIIWTPRAGLREIREVSSGNGKDRTKYVTYRYALTATWLICGPCRRLWGMDYNDFPLYTWDGTTETIHPSLAVPSSTSTPDPALTGALIGVSVAATSAQTVFDPVTGTYTLPEFRIRTGTETQLPDSAMETDIGVGKTSAMRGQTTFTVESFIIEPPVGTMAFLVEPLLNDIGDVCLDIWNDCGTPAALVDVSRITGEETDGFMLDSRDPGRDALEELAKNHRFKWCHRNGRETAIPLGGNVVVSIPRGDLRCRQLAVAGDGIDNPPNTVLSDADVILLPQRIEKEYHDAARQYHPNVRAAWRDAPPFGNQQDKQATSTNEVLDGAHAQRVADLELFAAWEEAFVAKILLGNEYRYLQATDPIELPIGADGLMTRFRITSMQKQQPGGVLSVVAVRESADMYNAPLGEDSEGLPPVVVQELGNITLFLMQLSAISDVQINGTRGTVPAPIVYALACGGGTVRIDSVAFYGTEADNDHAAWTANATMGYAVNALGDFAPGAAIIDEVNYLDVDILDGKSLSSATDADLNLNPRLNLLAVNQEEIQYRDASFLGIFDSKRRYRASGLRRGRRGTEWAIGSHDDGEPVALLSSAILLQFDPYYLKREIVVDFTVDETVSAFAMTIEGTNLKPHSPADVELVSVAMDGAITAKWQPRTRMVDAARGTWFTGVVPPSGETIQKFEVDILNSLGGVVDTIFDLPSPTFTYSAARMVDQFGSVQTTLRIEVFQISASVGRGYGTYKELVV